eukprot:UN07469
MYLSWGKEELCCFVPAAAVAYSYYHFGNNKLAALTIGFTGYAASGLQLGAQSENAKSGLCAENKYNIVSTSIICSSTVFFLLEALNKYEISTNGVIIAACGLTCGILRLGMNIYNNTWNVVLEKDHQLTPYDSYFVVSSILGAIFGAYVVFITDKNNKSKKQIKKTKSKGDCV